MPEQVHMGFVTTNYFLLVGAGIAFGPHQALGENFTMSPTGDCSSAY